MTPEYADRAEMLSLNAVATTVAGIALLGFWHSMNNLRDEVREFHVRISTHLFGAGGATGLTGAVHKLESDGRDVHDELESFRHSLEEATRTLDEIERRVRRLEDRRADP